MERLSFAPEAARTLANELLQEVTVAPLTAPVVRGAPFQAAVFRIGPGGRIARHPATVPQLLAVVDGSGWVSGDDGVETPISTGEAVIWRQGEEHETRSDTGLTAVIIEGEGLRLP